MNPADLRPGHRIAHTVPNMAGTITVAGRPWVDPDNDGSEIDRVDVEVDVSDASYAQSKWDPEDLPKGTGAVDFRFKRVMPTLRYSLIFHPDTDVTLENE